MTAVAVAAEWVRDADSLLVAAGAGMSHASGLPVFRGDGGLWEDTDLYKRIGVNFYDLANPKMFDRHPELAWGFYARRVSEYRASSPHEGYYESLWWGSDKPAGAWAFTSNVDRHFLEAGWENVNECHGTVLLTQCSSSCGRLPWDTPMLEWDSETMECVSDLPRCDQCGEIARPNVLMFYDSTWDSRPYDRTDRQFRKWVEQKVSPRTVVLEIGAGNAIPTVRTVARWAKSRGAKTIRINPVPDDSPAVDLTLKMDARDALMEIGANF